MSLALDSDTTGPGVVPAAAYAPSWIDRLTDWVHKLPVPAWLFYLAIGGLLGLTRTLIGWNDNSYPVGTFFHIHLLDGQLVVYFLIVLHYLDERAKAALAVFRPALNVDAAGYEELRYKLTTMPVHPVLMLSLIGFGFGLIYLPVILTAPELIASRYFTSPAATALDIAMTAFTWLTNAVFAYHTVRQLRLVSQIYTHHTNVSIFDSGPLYALSSVTAMTTVALLGLIYVFVVFYGSFEIDTVTNAIIAAVFGAVALVTFVWPLWGAHRLLQQEKGRRKGEIGRRLEATTNELHRRADNQDYAEMGNINDAIEGLTKEQELVAKASTWPWDPEAVRAIVTALLLPIVIWVITRLLERFGI